MPDKTLTNARQKISKVEKDLLKLDPFWKMCYPCKNDGRCCIGEDVDVSKEEWGEIKKFIETNPTLVNYGKIRLKNGKPCLFYCSQTSKCLIHDVRPLMCRYAPYQIVNAKGKQFCSIVDSECRNIKSIEINTGGLEKTDKPFIAKLNDRYYVLIDEIPEIIEYKKKKLDFLSTMFHNSFVK